MKHNRMTMGLVRAVITCAVLGLTTGKPQGSGSSAVVTLEKTVGSTVQFNISRDPAPYTYFTWWFSGYGWIITVRDGVNSTAPSYVDRITLFDNVSLELRNLTTKDSGDYRVIIVTTGGPTFSSEFLLKVHGPVSNVSLSASATELEEYEYVTLTCSASESYLWFSWFNNSRPMEKFPTSTDDYIDVFAKRFDTGPFTCEAHNIINRVSSEELKLTINYGPHVDLKAVPYEVIYTDGSSVTLVCTVDSKPEAEISWYFEDELLPSNGTELVLEDLTWEKRGSYECRAYNRKTNRIRWSYEYIDVEYKYHNDGLSVGATTGIAVACLVVGVGFAGGLAYLCHRDRKRLGAR